MALINHYKEIHIVSSEGLLEDPIDDFIKRIPHDISITLWIIKVKKNNFLLKKLIKIISKIEKISFLNVNNYCYRKTINLVINKCTIEDFPKKFHQTHLSKSLKLYLVNPDLLNIAMINNGGDFIATDIDPINLPQFSLASTLSKNDYKEFNIFSSFKKHPSIKMKHGLTSFFLLNKLKIEYAILENILSFIKGTNFFNAQIIKTSHTTNYNYKGDLLSLIKYLLSICIIKVKGRIKLILELTFNVDSLSESWTVGCLNHKTGEIFTLPSFFNSHLGDPFIFEYKGISYCFVEKFDFKNNGEIHVYDLCSKKYIGLALKETFHLSYPFIFTHNNKIYMLPETSANNDIRLYEANNFPLEWKLASVLKNDIRAVDSIIFQRTNKWFLISNIASSIVDNDFHSLKVYTSENLYGPYKEEDSIQCIFNDSTTGRNGGYFKKLNSHFRISQYYGHNCYGKSAKINQINSISKNGYFEEEFMINTRDFLKKSADELAFGYERTGFHHINVNDKYTVFDFKIKPKISKMISISHGKVPWI